MVTGGRGGLAHIILKFNWVSIPWGRSPEANLTRRGPRGTRDTLLHPPAHRLRRSAFHHLPMDYLRVSPDAAPLLVGNIRLALRSRRSSPARWLEKDAYIETRRLSETKSDSISIYDWGRINYMIKWQLLFQRHSCVSRDNKSLIKIGNV